MQLRNMRCKLKQKRRNEIKEILKRCIFEADAEQGVSNRGISVVFHFIRLVAVVALRFGW